MEKSELNRLTSALKADPGLRAELMRRAGDLDAALAWARGKGFAVSRQDLEPLLAGLDELSDDDLDQVAGGEDPWSGTTKP